MNRSLRLIMLLALLTVVLNLVAASASAQGPLTINKYNPHEWGERCLGWRMRYDIDVANEGNTTLHNVRIVDPLPEGTIPDDTITTQGYYWDWVDGVFSLVWPLGDLEPGARVKRLLELNTQQRRLPNYMVNTAYVYCDELPPSSSTWVHPYVECTPYPPTVKTPTMIPACTSTPVPTLAPGLVKAILQQGAGFYSGTADTYLSSSQAERLLSFSSEPRLSLSYTDGKAVLMRFDLSQVPKDAAVEQALLYLAGLDREGRHALGVRFYEVKRSWKVKEANWLNATRDTAWSVPGCRGELDRVAQPLATLTMDATWQQYTVDLTRVVAKWVANPSSNRGLLMESASGTDVQYDLASADYPYIPYRPRLVITFTQPEATATPTRTSTRTPTAMPTLTPTPTCTPETTPPVFRALLPWLVKRG